jgi:hypothetical protein
VKLRLSHSGWNRLWVFEYRALRKMHLDLREREEVTGKDYIMGRCMMCIPHEILFE